MSNAAQEIIVPPPRVFRIIFLYVGQGESTLLVVPKGDGHEYVLVDSHQDDSFGGIDLTKLFKDLLKGKAHGFHVYINTHPHNDHLGGLKKLYDEIGIAQVWHSGHKPGKDHKEAYAELEYVMNRIGKENVFVLQGSREDNKLDGKTVALGNVSYNVLAPAEYVSEAIEDEDAETRYRKIHEQCGILRFRYGKKEKQILITGDSNRSAWEQYVMYHRERLPSTVLSASHHGSNTFFWENSEPGLCDYQRAKKTGKPPRASPCGSRGTLRSEGGKRQRETPWREA
jgi:competence protein ComEC